MKKKPKLRPDYQVYSKLYYETRVKDIALAQWPAERAAILEKKMNGEDVKDPPEMPPLWFRNRVSRLEFAQESDDIKEEVERHRQLRDIDVEVEDSSDEDAYGDKEKAKQVAEAKARSK